MIKKILVLHGDPHSINSEIIFKSWKVINKSLKKRVCFISSHNLFEKQLKKNGYKVKLKKLKNINDHLDPNKLNIINIDLKFNNPYKINKKISSKFVQSSLNLAHKIALRDDISGIINCPINKGLLKKKKTGVTEYLAAKCNIKNNSEVMLLTNNILSVSPFTTHIDIKDISKKITKSLIINKTKTIQFWFKKILKKNPKIAMLGLNPHNAEFRKNSEENKIIIPAIKNLRKLGIKLEGPLAADTLFMKKYKKYDVVIGMFHDQILSPYKSIFKFNAINTTLGLKYLRASPDHGTGQDIIGKNIANASSLIKCINFINKFGR